MYKLDLHTHSIASRDGSLTIEDYERVISSGMLDFVAITDHNNISFAKEAKEKLPENIIIGEEILTKSGEIIGLFLESKIESGLSLIDTIQAIRQQNGIVYIPHPFDNFRHGLKKKEVALIINEIDIIECYNSRSFNFMNKQYIRQWAIKNSISYCASSDAHGKIGFGLTKTYVNLKPSKDNIVTILKSPKYNGHYAGVMARLYPTINRWRSLDNNG